MQISAVQRDSLILINVAVLNLIIALTAVIALAKPSRQMETTCVVRIGIGVKSGSPNELAAKTQLEKILKEYQVNDWLYTDTVVIDEKAIPHSHPVLTVNTRYLNNDPAQLATFLHEQFHWMVAARDKELELIMKAFASEYPDAPDALPLGARGKSSTYLHLLVCSLEYQAMIKLIGDERAKKLLQSWQHYTWVYDKVLTDKRVMDIIRSQGFVLTSPSPGNN